MATLAWRERRDTGYGSSFALALATHAILLAVLFFGVRFQSREPDSVTVELWEPIPAPRVFEPPPLKPAPKVEPEPPPPPPPKPEPKIEKPDIVEKAAPKPKTDPKPEPKPEPPKPKVEPPKPKPKPEPPKPKPVPKEPPRDLRAEQRMREQLALEQREASERLARELAARQVADARDRALATWIGQIRGKIRSNIREPIVAQVQGNPEAVFDVSLLPTGEVLNARLIKSSGNKAYDEELERAIKAASPLPKPEPQSLFQRRLELRFRPKDQ
jgi:colicin import membrane protein